MKLSTIKPDPNQPRRTFDAEKMAALVGSMKGDGFRLEYPILIDGNNVIIDGERRWRAAKQAGMTDVPVIVKADVTDLERLIYQLQSEGAELETEDKYKAWYKAYKLGIKFGKNEDNIAITLGVKPSTFRLAVKEYGEYLALEKSLSHKNVVTTFEDNYPAMAEVSREKDIQLKEQLAEKAVKEGWTQDKAREIRRAIKEKPIKAKEILSHDYSEKTGEFWKAKLEIAKAGYSKDEADELNKVGEKMDDMHGQIDAFSQIISYGLKMASAMKRFDYTKVTPEKRVELHAKIQKFIPFATGYITELEDFMIEQGELKRNKKHLKGGK